MKRLPSIPVLGFSDGTNAERVATNPLRPDDEEDWITFTIRHRRAHPPVFVMFPLPSLGRENKVGLPGTGLPGIFTSGRKGLSTKQSHEIFDRHLQDYSRKIRAIVEAYRLRNMETRKYRNWVVSDLVPEEIFVPDDWLFLDFPQGPEEPTIEYVQRILPSFDLHAWYDESVHESYMPQGWKGDRRISLPAWGSPTIDPITPARKTVAGFVTAGGRKTKPGRQWPHTVGEYDLVPRTELPLRFIRITHDEEAGVWMVQYGEEKGYATPQIQRSLDSQRETAGTTSGPGGRHNTASLPEMLKIFFLHGAQIQPESTRPEWRRTMIEPWEDLLHDDPEEVEVFRLLGEEVPALWPWKKLEEWDRSRQ